MFVVIPLLALLSSSGPPPVRVVAETERLLVIEKPHNVPFHRDRDASISPSNDLKHASSAVVDTENISGGNANGEDISTHDISSGREGIMELVRRAQQQDGGISYQGPLFPVHRLDAVTSGILLLAKDSDAAGKCARAFQRRKADRESPNSNKVQSRGGSSTNSPLIVKHYLAVVSSKPKKAGGWVRGDMVPGRRGAWKLLRSMDDPAITRFDSLGTLESTLAKPSTPLESSELAPQVHKPSRPSLRLILLRPETGRTHQLRVALKSLGTPVFGDALYGGGKPCDPAAPDATTLMTADSDTAESSTGDCSPPPPPPAQSPDRCYLHAAALQLNAAALGLQGLGEPETFTFLCAPGEGAFWTGPALQDFFDEVLKARIRPSHINTENISEPSTEGYFFGRRFDQVAAK